MSAETMLERGPGANGATPPVLENLSASQLLEWAITNFGRKFAITTSFQSEGMVLIDMAVRISPDVRVITLDTGRLPEETHLMMEQVRSRYNIRVETVSPDAREIEAMVRLHGPNLFFREVPLRRLCCEIRKVRPLDRKLEGMRAWATGMRRAQTEERTTLPRIEDRDGRWKLNPLADWSSDDVTRYTVEHDLPRHPLYAKGYTSIGCAPCTRPTVEGEDERAGRWYWETEAAKECGIHFTPDGRAARTVDVLLAEILRVA